MHSTWVRSNAVFFFALSCLGVLAGLSAVTTYWHEAHPQVNVLEVNRLKSLRTRVRQEDRRTEDRAFFYFDLDADLSSVFNWNVKQLFLFVVAEYESNTNKVNQVVVWDKIVQTPEEAKLDLTEVPIKYYLVDHSDQLRDTEVKLSLHWDIMPITGLLYMFQQGNHTIQMPSDYK